MKNKIIILSGVIVFSFLIIPIVSYAYENPTLVRILNYYVDSDGRITFKWQQDYDGCKLAPFDCSGGIQLNTLQFPDNGGEGFYNADNDFGSNKGFMNFTTTCNELTATGRICISHPRILKNRYNNDIIASNDSGLLYSDVASYVGSSGIMHTIYGGIFRVVNDWNWQLSKTNHFSFGDAELPYVPPTAVKNPVLIVPGLLGTEMKNGDELLWADLGRMFIDITDSFMDPLAFSNDLNPSVLQLLSSNIIRTEKLPGYTFDYTDGLITEFKNQGYMENQNLFTFPYDWRYGASGKYPDGKTNSDLLTQKIQDIMAQTGSNKVDVVAHSEGGLIVKKYVMDHQADHHIGKAVFVGVPNTGAPKSIKVLLQGDNFGIPWLSQDEMKKIAQNLPTAYDLSPSQQYYDTKGSFVEVIDEGSFAGNEYTDKDLNYQDFENFLTNDHRLNSLALNGAEGLHTKDFDNFDIRTAGVDLYAIDGCKSATIEKIREDRFKNAFGQSFVEYKRPKFTPGDNTVPLESATNLPINAGNKFYFLTADHSKMLSQDGSRQKIVNIISASSLDANNITQDITKCNLNGKAISVFSPIDILVTDQHGNRLGIASDGSIVNEIANADFEIMGEHKFLYLPTDDGQVYTIDIKGTAAGNFTIDNQDISGSQSGATEVFSNLPVTADLTGQINLGNSTTLTVTQHPGDQPEIILPSATVNTELSEDFLPPVSGATLSGAAGQPGFYRSDVNVGLNAADNLSGVLAIHYNVDGAGYQAAAADSTVVAVTNEGSHIISFFATDNAGNNEQEKTITFTIDKTGPNIDILKPIGNGSYTFKQIVLANWSASDNLSGIASALGTTAPGNPIDTGSIGKKNFTVTAIDKAGNNTQKTIYYTVVNYVFTGLQAPTTISKTDFKKTSTVPIKFMLKDLQSNSISNAVATLKVNGVNAVSSGGSNVGNIFKYDLLNQQYIFNLSAKSLSTGVNNLVISLNDGTFYSFTITIK